VARQLQGTPPGGSQQMETIQTAATMQMERGHTWGTLRMGARTGPKKCVIVGLVGYSVVLRVNLHTSSTTPTVTEKQEQHTLRMVTRNGSSPQTNPIQPAQSTLITMGRVTRTILMHLLRTAPQIGITSPTMAPCDEIAIA
jgi:hypothetical protein